MDLGGVVLNINTGLSVIPHQALEITVVDAGWLFIEEDIPLGGLDQIAGFSEGHIAVACAGGVLRAANPVHKTIHGNAPNARRSRRIPRIAGAFVDAAGFGVRSQQRCGQIHRVRLVRKPAYISVTPCAVGVIVLHGLCIADIRHQTGIKIVGIDDPSQGQLLLIIHAEGGLRFDFSLA